MRLGLWLAVWATVAIGWTSSSSGAPPNWPASLTIGTASPGGVYYVYGQGLAPILNEALGIAVSAQATQGPEQNILLLESGPAPVGLGRQRPPWPSNQAISLTRLAERDESLLTFVPKHQPHTSETLG